MKMVNKSKEVITNKDLGIKALKPQETCEVLDGYAWPRSNGNNKRLESIVEMIAPGLEPHDKAQLELWKYGVPPRAAEILTLGIEGLTAKGYPEGVAVQWHASALASATRFRRRQA